MGMDRLIRADRIIPQSNSIRYARRFKDFFVAVLSNIWSDLAGATDKVYVVQTSTRIVERCLLMATDRRDLVLDPTCGSGTTASVAEQWGRRWITIDTSRVALALARACIMGSRYARRSSSGGLLQGLKLPDYLQPTATRWHLRLGEKNSVSHPSDCIPQTRDCRAGPGGHNVHP
jgi:adenine-specific DNA-methyltransferase